MVSVMRQKFNLTDLGETGNSLLIHKDVEDIKIIHGVKETLNCYQESVHFFAFN